MPLVPAFTTSQSVSTPTTFTITDSSTGSDGAITKRSVTIQKADGTYLTPSGNVGNNIAWPYANNTIVLNVLDKDYAVIITVFWQDVSSNNLYTVSTPAVFTLNTKLFLYNLLQAQASGFPSIINDDNYWENYNKLYALVRQSENLISLIGDIFSSQKALDLAKNMIVNQNINF